MEKEVTAKSGAISLTLKGVSLRDVITASPSLATVLENLIAAIRWRYDFFNCDGEDLCGDEREAFERAERALLAEREGR